MNRGHVVQALREAARLVGVGPDVDALRAIQTAQDALDGAKVAHLAGLSQSGEFEAEGASSVTSWVRLQLRVSARDASALTRSASTLARLPQVAEAAMAGQIRAAHVNVFGYGLKHVGEQHMAPMMEPLLKVARTCEPGELFRVMRALREAVFPDELDQAWADGMEKADLQVNAVPQGFHVKGFLPIHVGSKFHTVLGSLSAPVDADDKRTGAADGAGGFIFKDHRSHVMASDLRHRRAVHQEALRIHHTDLAIRRRRAERASSA